MFTFLGSLITRFLRMISLYIYKSVKKVAGLGSSKFGVKMLGWFLGRVLCSFEFLGEGCDFIITYNPLLPLVFWVRKSNLPLPGPD